MSCEERKNCCTCPERVSETVSVSVNHWFTNFEWQGFRLHYDCLDAPGSENRICLHGICRTCGKCLCIGQQFTEAATGDAFLTAAYHWCYGLWDSIGRHALPDGMTSFRALFESLFHPWDINHVSQWLDQPGNQDVWKQYRHHGEVSE